MKIYQSKLNPNEQVKAVQLTETLSGDANALAKMPNGFKSLSRVNGSGESFAFLGARGKMGQWFVHFMGTGGGLFLDDSKFKEKYFEKSISELVSKLNQKALNQNALNFEMGIKKLVEIQMQLGLTVTEAVGTLDLCKMDIANQFFNGQKANEFFHPQG